MTDRLTPQREAEIAARRERYAKALYEFVNGAFAWEACADQDSWLAEADAAITVADAELTVERTEHVAERDKLIRWHREDDKALAEMRGTIQKLRTERDQAQALVAELEEQRERRRLRLVALQNDALSMRGSLSPNGEDRKVPFPLGEALTPAVDWLIARVTELEALTPAPIQTCRVCGAGYSYGQPCSACEFNARMAAETGGAS